MVRLCSASGCAQVGELVCSACRAVYYCSKECQKQAWRAGHKQECKSVPLQSIAYRDCQQEAHGDETGFFDMIYPGDCRYIGNFLNGKPHGRGKTVFSDGRTHTGEYKNSLRDGIGNFVDPKAGYTYIGEFKNNMFNGQGREVFTSDAAPGACYEGTFVDGQKHGKGKSSCPVKGTRDGDWVRNVFEGQGKATLPDGYEYIGQFRNNESDGWGRAVEPDGTVYEGQWIDSSRHGKGKQKYGPFVAGFANQVFKRECRRFSDGFAGVEFSIHEPGTVYEGEFVNGKEHGSGKLTAPHGRVIEGTWDNGRLLL